MSKIYIDTNCKAPCCPCMIVDEASGRNLLVQTDWDFPGVASTFGWNMADVQRDDGHSHCQHSFTDGTIDCAGCGVTASQFIDAAREYIEQHDGATADDPGYFESR